MKPHSEVRLLDTPFGSRVRDACEVHQWEDWKGYLSPVAYDDVELEYFAVRNATGVFDLSPMTKYRITGPDAQAFLNRVMTRDIRRLAPGRVGYSVWCNDAGMVLDDGTPVPPRGRRVPAVRPGTVPGLAAMVGPGAERGHRRRNGRRGGTGGAGADLLRHLEGNGARRS